MFGTTGGPHDPNGARLQPGTARNVRERRTRDRDHAPRMARHSCAARQRYRHAAPATPVFTSSDSRESCFSHEFLEYETAVIATQSPSAKSITPACVVIDARDVPDQRLHDASRFPLVRLRRRAVQPGYAFAWGAEMQRLLSLKTPFVIVSEHNADETAGKAGDAHVVKQHRNDGDRAQPIDVGAIFHYPSPGNFAVATGAWLSS